MNFDALDNQPVNLVMLFLVPQGQFQKHLHTLANIAKLLHKADFRQALEQAPDADAMLKIIRSQGQKLAVTSLKRYVVTWGSALASSLVTAVAI